MISTDFIAAHLCHKPLPDRSSRHAEVLLLDRDPISFSEFGRHEVIRIVAEDGKLNCYSAVEEEVSSQMLASDCLALVGFTSSVAESVRGDGDKHIATRQATGTECVSIFFCHSLMDP